MNDIEQSLLNRYFAGQTSEEEKESIYRWIEQNEANRKRFIRERICFDASILIDKPVDSIERPSQMSSFWRWGMKVAASIVFLIGCFYLYDHYRLEQFSQTFQEVHVPAGNRTNILLPDGTVVWLNANTSLRYPMAFSRKNREIRLDGEAYLEVAKDKKPFIVKTEKYDVEVLGTIFNVEAYADKSRFRTSLYEGKVKLYNTAKPDPVFLTPGQTAELVDGVLQVVSTKDLNSFRWKDGLIYIEDKSFGEIMEQFEKFYDVRIVINNRKVKDLGYRGKLRISDGVDHALRVLQKDFPFVYKYDEEKSMIYIN